jgi:hypothetical protein
MCDPNMALAAVICRALTALESCSVARFVPERLSHQPATYQLTKVQICTINSWNIVLNPRGLAFSGIWSVLARFGKHLLIIARISPSQWGTRAVFAPPTAHSGTPEEERIGYLAPNPDRYLPRTAWKSPLESPNVWGRSAFHTKFVAPPTLFQPGKFQYSRLDPSLTLTR